MTVTHIGVAARKDLDAVTHALKAERVRRGDLTQQRLAAALGVAMGSLKDREARRDNPTMINCVRWARYLGFKLVVDDAAVVEVHAPATPAVDEDWESAEIRRLSAALRAARRRRRIPCRSVFHNRSSERRRPDRGSAWTTISGS